MQTTERMLTNEHLSRSGRTVAIWGIVGSRSSETSSPHWLGRRKLLTADPFGRVMRRRERIHALASLIDEIQLPHRVDRGTLLSVPVVAVAAWQFAERLNGERAYPRSCHCGRALIEVRIPVRMDRFCSFRPALVVLIGWFALGRLTLSSLTFQQVLGAIGVFFAVSFGYWSLSGPWVMGWNAMVGRPHPEGLYGPVLEKRIRKPDRSSLVLQHPGEDRRVRIPVTGKLFETVRLGDPMRLKVRQGSLGFYYWLRE